MISIHLDWFGVMRYGLSACWHLKKSTAMCPSKINPQSLLWAVSCWNWERWGVPVMTITMILKMKYSHGVNNAHMMISLEMIHNLFVYCRSLFLMEGGRLPLFITFSNKVLFSPVLICLLAGFWAYLHKNYWTDFYKALMEDHLSQE